ncbi:hypothetical protein B0H11DRAFT_2027340 [Mycena galericulata]|nr:hypothetical protein B0H11DRAFT_2027340 [Mycena galericulata]
MNFFHDHVRHVAFVDPDASQVLKIMSTCNATVNLMILFGTVTPALLPVLGALPLERLFIDLHKLFPSPTPDFSHPIFNQLTHFDLCSSRHDADWNTLNGLAQLPRLTHLAFHGTLIPNSVYENALVHCKFLRVLADTSPDLYSLDKVSRLRAPLAADPRFVILVMADTRLDWELGATGREDRWATADALVLNRRAGKTSEYCHVLQPDVAEEGQIFA